jgi:putative glutamine amidotransferase
VQWHPEFHPPGDSALFNDTPMLNDFLNTARSLRSR